MGDLILAYSSPEDFEEMEPIFVTYAGIGPSILARKVRKE